MKQTIEIPDIEIKPELKQYPNDVMKVTIRKDEVEFNVCVDGAGNYFKINRKELMELIK